MTMQSHNILPEMRQWWRDQGIEPQRFTRTVTVTRVDGTEPEPHEIPVNFVELDSANLAHQKLLKAARKELRKYLS